MKHAKLALGLCLGLCASGVAQTIGMPARSPADLDRDTIDDVVEQSLLEQFLPQFRLSSDDCDVAPSLFMDGALDPVALQQDGTIYGQAFPKSGSVAGQKGVVVELHFYHLWQQSCGKSAHPLDVEHVSALVTADSLGAPTSDWEALYWYASAREGMTCDKSHAAGAGLVEATNGGPAVSVSGAKHASYLDSTLCQQGCGSDRCDGLRPLAVPRVVNLGEPDFPLNGSGWTASPLWALRDKMNSDFTDAVLAELQVSGNGQIVSVRPSSSGIEVAAGATANALAIAGGSTGRALDSAQRHTGDALDTSARSVGNAFRKAATSTGKFLGSDK
jgi:hypothetical protein